MASTGSDFWDQVGGSKADVEHLYAYLLERATPASSHDLTLHLIEARRHEEEKRIAEAAAHRAPIYQPKQSFMVGQHVSFPALGNREGVVKKIRDGDNPRVGPFKVIAVKFDNEPQPHELAAEYALPHLLSVENRVVSDSLAITAEQVVAQYGETIRTHIVERLRQDPEFIHSDDLWFLKELIPQIGEGYLNIAEAAIEHGGDAIRSKDLLRILEIPVDAKAPTAGTFALNHALADDPRFDNVGPAGDSRWFLSRLEPPEAREYPALLHAPSARAVSLPAELEVIAAELFDEADINGDVNHIVAEPREEINLILTYPHRRCGTLPLTAPVRAFLPNFSHPRLRINFVDASSDQKIAGYAVADGNYLAGLSGWFNARRLAPGALITLKHGPDPLTLVIDYQPQRERSLWVRVARVQNERLTFAQEKRPLSHKYDEEMLILIADPVGIDKLTDSPRTQTPLAVLLDEIFPELAKLSSSGHVHAKTLYAAVNFIRRAGPRAVFGALTESRVLTSAGGGYFVLQDARTP